MVLAAGTFAAVCKARGLGVPVAELRFAPPRRWRFDYSWEDSKVALEVEGGVWTGGRHVRGAGYVADMDKYNAAALAGWIVLRTTPNKLLTVETLEMVRAAQRLRAA